MTGAVPYLHFPNTAEQALGLYRSVFGGELTLHTFADFGRADGPASAIAHGILTGPVPLFGADAGAGESTLQLDGVLFALLGAADPATLERWFAALSDGGTVVAPLERQEWGAVDGQVRDRFGVTWLIGYKD